MSKKKPVRRIKKTLPPAGGLLDGLAVCGAHGCPMITVGDAYYFGYRVDWTTSCRCALRRLADSLGASAKHSEDR